MTSLSQTSYSFQSTAPKDRGGAKMLGWFREDASVSPITLPKGIGASVSGASLLFSMLGVATHTQASPVEATHPGVQLGGVYLSSLTASKNAVASGQFRLAGISKYGEILATPASTITSLVTTSRNTITGSALVRGINFISLNKNDQASVIITDNLLFKHAIVADGTSFSRYEKFDGGMFISTSLTINIFNGGGTASAVIHLLE